MFVQLAFRILTSPVYMQSCHKLTELSTLSHHLSFDNGVFNVTITFLMFMLHVLLVSRKARNTRKWYTFTCIVFNVDHILKQKSHKFHSLNQT